MGMSAVAPPRITAKRSSVIAARTDFSRQTWVSPAVIEETEKGPVWRSLSRAFSIVAPKPKSTQPTAVKLLMANGEIFDQPGKVETIEADFNNETGTIAFRAGFPNPDRLLRHGETGEILMTTPLPHALLIPQKAVFRVLDKAFVYVVEANNVVRAREITIGEELPHQYIVSNGLREGERVLIDGLRRVRDGDTIEPNLRDAEQVFTELSQIPAE